MLRLGQKQLVPGSLPASPACEKVLEMREIEMSVSQDDFLNHDYHRGDQKRVLFLKHCI